MGRPNSVVGFGERHLLSYAAPRFCRGKRFFVDPTYGKPWYSGERPEEPFQSISHALHYCRPGQGDQIILLNGYDSSLTLGYKYPDRSPVTLSLSGISILLDARNHTFYLQNAGESFFVVDASDITISSINPKVEARALVLSPGTGNSSFIELTGNADRTEISKLRIQGDGLDYGINYTGVCDGTWIHYVRMHQCSIKSSVAHTRCLLRENLIQTFAGIYRGVEFSDTGCTGIVWNTPPLNSVGDMLGGCEERTEYTVS